MGCDLPHPLGPPKPPLAPQDQAAPTLGTHRTLCHPDSSQEHQCDIWGQGDGQGGTWERVLPAGVPVGCHRVLGPAVLPSTREHLQSWGATLSNTSPFQPTAAPRGDGEQKLGWHSMGIVWHSVATWAWRGTARASSSVVVPHPHPLHTPYMQLPIYTQTPCTPKETQTPRDIQSWQMPPRQEVDPRPCQDVATSHAITSKIFLVFLPHFVVFPPILESISPFLAPSKIGLLR